MKPKFFINFLKRYLRLIIVWLVFVIAGRFDGVVFFFGHVFYIAELLLSSAVGALFIRHLFLRQTIDYYTVEPPGEPSRFSKDWDACDPTLKVVLTILVFLTLFIGACLIAASIAK